MGVYSTCGGDPKTTGHVDLIRIADNLAAAVLDDRSKDALCHAERYRNTRLSANVEAAYAIEEKS